MLEVRLAARRGDFSLEADLALPTPGVTALFGRSGCGKSTLINLLAGLIRPEGGHIRIDGTTLYDAAAGIDVAPERRAIGYVFQESRLFPHLTVAANLRYGAQRRRGRDRGIGFDGTVALLGLAPLLARRPHQLSGGERQRVAIGRALLAQPRLLLLDEPLASLDAARREEILPALERLRDESALPMVYVSHQFEEVLRLATNVVVMEAGRVRAQGDLATISRSRALLPLLGPEGLGALVEGEVESAAGGLARVRVGGGTLQVERSLQPGRRVRIQLLARDLILATQPPRALSVRNSLRGVIRTLEYETLEYEPDGSCLLEVDVGGPIVLVRVTGEARAALGLQPGLEVWVLVKAVSLRGHVFPGAAGAAVPA
ncbi:MAG TPA: molybdenum ABC transporter ATP-binding protein [Steroidobacteraceae bacterium]|nr:molybdenum ABC transporter ATP-binding protein [Steroidobacteraceae bacterium]